MKPSCLWPRLGLIDIWGLALDVGWTTPGVTIFAAAIALYLASPSSQGTAAVGKRAAVAGGGGGGGGDSGAGGGVWGCLATGELGLSAGGDVGSGGGASSSDPPPCAVSAACGACDGGNRYADCCCAGGAPVGGCGNGTPRGRPAGVTVCGTPPAAAQQKANSGVRLVDDLIRAYTTRPSAPVSVEASPLTSEMLATPTYSIVSPSYTAECGCMQGFQVTGCKPIALCHRIRCICSREFTTCARRGMMPGRNNADPMQCISRQTRGSTNVSP